MLQILSPSQSMLASPFSMRQPEIRFNRAFPYRRTGLTVIVIDAIVIDAQSQYRLNNPRAACRRSARLVGRTRANSMSAMDYGFDRRRKSNVSQTNI
jgi:hypothetical protein